MKQLKDFEERFQKLNKSSFWKLFNKSDDEENYLKFVWDLMKSPYVEYHYSLMIREDIKHKNLQQSLWHRFDEHGESAELLLLSKLENNEDIDFHPDIIFTLGKIISNNKKSTNKEKILQYACQFAVSPNTYLRDRAIIVLGWIGGSGDIQLLVDRLLNDPDNKCRAWAASAFMQIWFRRKSDAFVEKILPHLYRAIQSEPDDFALGCMITVVQEFTQKKFGLSQKAVDNIDKEKISQARIKVLRFFNKKYSDS